MILKFIFLISIIFILSNSYAEVSEKECSNIDIRTKNPALAEFFSTPRDQGEIGWCYGFAAADLLSVEVGVPVSAFHTSAIYNKSIANSPIWKSIAGVGRFIENHSEGRKSQFEEIYEGGHIDKALTEAKKEGKICSEKDVPYFVKAGDAAFLISYLEEVKKTIKSKDLSLTQKCEYFKASFPSVLDSDLKKLFNYLLNEDLNVVLEKTISDLCPTNKLTIPDFKIKHIYPPMLDYDKDMQALKKIFFNKIAEVLESGKPMAIEYQTRFVEAYRDEHHESIVTARRWNKGKCEYKIRNSFGKACGYYKKGIDCNLEEGSYWVDENIFYNMVDGITYLSK